ncbi:MAG: DUF502 domain-containing protein [Alphaproteobacteria bacterium]
MVETAEKKPGPFRSVRRYILIGLLTVAPLAITWIILEFLFTQLSNLGEPWVRGLARGVRPQSPALAELMVNEVLMSVAAALIVLAFLFFLGWATGRVVGQRMIGLFEQIISAIPFVDSVYRATKRFVSVAGSSPEGGRSVVLINFPSRDMKAVGIMTRVLRDSETGEELAAVYMPTSPNPTSGYIEIMPMDKVIRTDWTFDQAMSFIVTGGSSSPDEIHFHRARDTVESS